MRNLLHSLTVSFASIALAASLFLLPDFAIAQSESPLDFHDGVYAPSSDVSPGVLPSVLPAESPEALWDIQFNYNATALSGRAGMAGIVKVDTVFWVSRWQNDSIHRFSINGQFLGTFIIPGLSGVRSFTKDDTYVYAGKANDTIYRIDPTTSTLAPPHIKVSSTIGGVRHCTFSNDLNSNQGGFYVGNFNTAIYAVSRTGTTLSSIPAATHGLTGMYGSCYDNVSLGGPFLWVFSQMAPSNMMINRLQLPTGTQTLVIHDVNSDVGVAQSSVGGLAGGMTLEYNIIPSKFSLVGVAQGTPNIIFGYELAEPVIPAVDAKITNIRPIEGYTQIPSALVLPESFEVTIFNNGLNTLDTMYVDFIVKNGGNTVFTDTRFETNIPTATGNSVISATFTPANGVGTYDVWAIARTSLSQVDSVSMNDTVMFSFAVSDSTFARDNNVPNAGAGYSVGGGGEFAYITANYTLTAPATVTAVWVKLSTPVTGDTTRAVVVNTISNIVPDLVLSLGTPTVIDANQDEYLLNIPGGLTLSPGVYSFGCYQGYNASIGLAQSSAIYTPDVNYFYVNGGSWTASGVQTARFIRPVFGTPVGVGSNQAAHDFVQLYPNPSTGTFMLAFTEAATEAALVTVTNPMGQVLHKQEVPVNGQAVTIDFSQHGNGIYFVNVDNGVQSTTQKVLISK